MINQQLLDYIRGQVQRGQNKEAIKQELLKAGWQVGDIEEALKVVNSAQPPNASVTSSSAQEEALIPSILPGVGDLLKRTFSVYKARLGTFVGIMILPLIVAVLGILLLIPLVFISDPGGNFFTAISLVIIWALAMVIIGFWAQIALIFAIRDREEKIGITESFKKSWHKIISFAWVSFLAGFITLGGSMLFIIPGIIFSIWFAFSVYVLISEDLRGMNALFRSKQLVVGYWWKVLWKFFLLGIALLVPYILIYIILAFALSANLADLVVRVLSALVITPFASVFTFLLYEDLKRQKAQVAFEPPKKGTKIKYILVGIIGFLLIPAILISIVLLSLDKAKESAQEASIMAMMNQLRPAMELYWMENDTYSGADCSLTKLAPVCSSIKAYTGEMPTIESSAEAYCFYVKLQSGEYICFSSIASFLDYNKTTIFPGGPGYCDGVTFDCP